MDKYEGSNRRKWSVTKEISLGDVIGLASAFAAVLLAYGKLDTRVSLVEQSQVSQTAASDRSINRMEQAISEINHKLDRLIERR